MVNTTFKFKFQENVFAKSVSFVIIRNHVSGFERCRNFSEELRTFTWLYSSPMDKVCQQIYTNLKLFWHTHKWCTKPEFTETPKWYFSKRLKSEQILMNVREKLVSAFPISSQLNKNTLSNGCNAQKYKKIENTGFGRSENFGFCDKMCKVCSWTQEWKWREHISLLSGLSHV